MASGRSERMNVVRRGVDPLAPEDCTAELRTNIEVLREHGFQIDTWTPAAIWAMPLAVSKFIKKVRIITSVADAGQRSIMIGLGPVRGYYNEATHCTLRNFVQLCDYLRTPEGQAAVRSRMFSAKLEKRAAVGQQPSEVAFLAAFQQQVGDLSHAEKTLGGEFDVKIQELQRQINATHAEKDRRLKKLKKKFKPSGSYEPINDVDLSNRCIELYRIACSASGVAAAEIDEQSVRLIEAKYGPTVRDNHMLEFIRSGNHQEALRTWLDEKIRFFRSSYDTKQAPITFNSWRLQVEERLLRYPLQLRKELMNIIPVGVIPRKLNKLSTWPLAKEAMSSQLMLPQTKGMKKPAPINKSIENTSLAASLLQRNPRLVVMCEPVLGAIPGIPHSRSKFEAGVRKIIGGGEMSTWKVDSSKYRGGGNLSDALKLLADASPLFPGSLLERHFSVDSARGLLQLPCGLRVPDGRVAVSMKNFNQDATAGPVLRAFGVKKKWGLRKALEDYAWDCYDAYVSSEGNARKLPFITARVGYRTKLLERKEAFEKLRTCRPLGRCVMMLDACEQAFSSPLYNVLSQITNSMRHEDGSGFRNSIVRASSDWMFMWDEIKTASVIVELDWKKFDRERPREDIEFMISVIISCFEARDSRERYLLDAYSIMLKRALIERVFITDDGGIFSIDGMVPSGSLWTGWLDTALNILYLYAALTHVGINFDGVRPKCAGDDNLTIFRKSYSDRRLRRIKAILNEWFRAGIEDDEFIIHRPPYHVTKSQACFPAGTDLTKGTSKLLHIAQWVPFVDELHIDQPAGMSHRWKYNFEGRPKFLSCYWLANGRPIRPTYVNAEKLLFPEGIHTNIERYEAAVISMVVDNPWNQHNVNHMMHRFCIIQQLKRYSSGGVPVELILHLSKIRPEKSEAVPFPMVGYWRRADHYVDMEDEPLLKQYIQDFRSFTTGVTSLYCRRSTGGIDSWKFMDFIRGEADLGEGQFGNEMDAWIKFLRENPLSRYLKPIKSFRAQGEEPTPSQETLHLFNVMITALNSLSETSYKFDCETFARFVMNLLRT
ncbi:polyprotein [Epipogium amalgavirus 1]|nr:polyprotein [Epipogium amalgavirus 1]